MLRSIHCLQDVVDWGMCTGCGACYSLCTKNAVTLENIEHVGIRPRFKPAACAGCTECLDICPGYGVDASKYATKCTCAVQTSHLIGPTIEVWEGYAADNELRFRASSGGVLTALSLYCLEQEHMAFIFHTGMDPMAPWKNITVQSSNRQQLIRHAGSRYNASSPCDSLALIEACDRPCVFIGKPCDVAAVAALRAKRPALDKNLGMVLTFFCAGTPSVSATLDLLSKLAVDAAQVRGLRYRGNGWPGGFSIKKNTGSHCQVLSYEDSWHFLQKYRCLRCHLCPDGLGEMADISCGDAWHRHDKNSNDPGRSLVLVRSEHGREMLKKAIRAGYIQLTTSTPENVIKAQGLVARRRKIFGRLLAMKLLLIPATQFTGFNLFRNWVGLSLLAQIKTVFGTLKRLLHKKLWHKNSLDQSGRTNNFSQNILRRIA
ncbi:MAG: Coenzyme F420 hydrogenase/dehydrogenase, beta subunit C-terminal domain [Deltaproteobacteria bacterium]|nr:Coenzyme F420 hydrogenase/dehydrogenase, beta subunit C-terminal domain [Deltaproteobacteria bacterium]